MTDGCLCKVSLPVLEHLLQLVNSGALRLPLTETKLQARGLGGLWPEIATFGDLDKKGFVAVIKAVVAERTARPKSRMELVWTGPETRVSAARDTAVVIRELFAKASQSVLVAGFAFTGGERIFAPLHAAMRARGVAAKLFLHLDDVPGRSPEESASIGVRRFLDENWPFGDPVPEIYYDPRTVTPGSSINLHAKCLVVDERLALIGSANFTHNAHVRNIEVGALVEDSSFAHDLARQWQGLVEAGLVQRWQRPVVPREAPEAHHPRETVFGLPMPSAPTPSYRNGSKEGDFECLSLPEVSQRIRDVVGLEQRTAEAIAAVLFHCGVPPKGLEGPLHVVQQGAGDLARWIAKNGGPDVVSALQEIDCLLKEKLIFGASLPLEDTTQGAPATNSSEVGALSTRSEWEVSYWLYDEGVDGRPQKRPVGKHSREIFVPRRGVDSFLVVAKAVLVENGFKSGLPSEYVGISEAERDEGRSAIPVLARLMDLLSPTGSDPPSSSGQQEERYLESLHRQSNGRGNLKLPTMRDLTGMFLSLFQQFRRERVWVPRLRG